jgi:hypothetical protein
VFDKSQKFFSFLIYCEFSAKGTTHLFSISFHKKRVNKRKGTKVSVCTTFLCFSLSFSARAALDAWSKKDKVGKLINVKFEAL